MHITIIGYGWLGKPLGLYLKTKGHHLIGSTTTKEKQEHLTQLGLSSFLLQLSHDSTPHISSSALHSDWVVLNIPPSRLGDHYALALTHVAEQFSPTTRFIFTSSTSVYDDINGTVDETSIYIGSSPRGKTLLAAEKALHSAVGDRLTILRLGGLYGEKRHPVFYMTGKTYPDGEAPVNMASLDLCIQAISTIIDHQVTEELFNVCEMEHPTKRDFYTTAAQSFGVDAPEFGQEKNSFKIVNAEKIHRLFLSEQ